MQPVNIGILAHVDAGKTSLTERLLYDTGVITELGSVDAGTTVTDTGEIERSRGITIRSAVASFMTGDRRVNLIDTPGHSDFVAEVERALSVLDGAVLVLSAVEGVQPHTRVLMKILKSLRLPTLIFANKIDRLGARGVALAADITRLLTPAIVPMGTVREIGTPGATFRGYAPDDAVASWAPVLADADDDLLAALIDGVPSGASVRSALRAQVAAGRVYPLIYGSALSGTGVPELLDAIARLLPPAAGAEARLRGRVFAIERVNGSEKLAYVRSYGGELRDRQRVTGYRRGPDGRIVAYRGQVTSVSVVGVADGSGHCLRSGHIAAVRGLSEVRIGDQIGSPDGLDESAHFARPSLETLVRPRDAAQTGALHAALLSLADSDPLIQARVAPDSGSSVLLYGEVQKEVIGATLASGYHIPVTFEESRIMHLERPIGAGSAVEIIGHGFLATVGLRVEPGAGVTFRLEVERGSLLPSFMKALEETVHSALEQGAYGWPVTDVTVTLTHSGYWAPTTAAGDFRKITPYVLMQALAAARTRVYEPCHAFDLDIPLDRLGPVTAHLAQIGTRVETTVERDGSWHVTGQIPARLVPGVGKALPGLSSGEGVWSSRLAGDRAVLGTPPRRRRTDGNPFDRVEYMRFVAQRPAS